WPPQTPHYHAQSLPARHSRRNFKCAARAKHHDALQHANRLQELVRFLELDLHATRRQSYALCRGVINLLLFQWEKSDLALARSGVQRKQEKAAVLAGLGLPARGPGFRRMVERAAE